MALTASNLILNILGYQSWNRNLTHLIGFRYDLTHIKHSDLARQKECEQANSLSRERFATPRKDVEEKLNRWMANSNDF